MSIKDISKKIKPYLQGRVIVFTNWIKNRLNIAEDLFVVFIIILVGFAGFGLGKLSASEKKRANVSISPATVISFDDGTTDFVAVDYISDVQTETSFVATIPASARAMVASETAQGLLVASKSGKKYHFPWCAGASQIAEKNKIWFASYAEARQAGYTPASNCKGLE